MCMAYVLSRADRIEPPQAASLKASCRVDAAVRVCEGGKSARHRIGGTKMLAEVSTVNVRSEVIRVRR